MKTLSFGLTGLVACLLSGCAAKLENPATPAATPASAKPFMAEFSASGHATILDAPPAEFTPVRPDDPPPPTAQQIADSEQFQRVGTFQNSVMAETMRLSTQLQRAERGNFVSHYFDNEGDPSVVFQFLRDGPATLRKYTRHSRFIGKTVRWSIAQLNADAKWMWDMFGQDRVIQSTGIGANTVNARISVAEREFRELVRRKGVTIPESVVLEFNSAPIVPLINLPLAAARDDSVPLSVAPHIRIFPRHDRPAGVVHSINSVAKIILKDGCFRASDQGDALVLFPFGAQLFVDGEGYLAFGREPTPDYARVGEVVIFMGSINAVTESALLDPVHAACGPGKVIKVEGLASASARDRQQTLNDDIEAVRRLRAEFGLSQEKAQRAFDWLKRRQAKAPQIGPDGKPMPPVTATLIINAPPGPPVSDPASCPAGSKLSFGLCRTPEGWLRPLPAWLAEFLEQNQ